MKSTAPLPKIPLFICTASSSSQCPFPFKEKEQAEVRQSLTFCPHATATGFQEFSGNSLAFSKGIKPQKQNSLLNSGNK
ncbi:hypothetical protein [Pedobacter cryotolerans]|uniref:Uncharacterized protein n=1 Tax=Pedobacter cryotolerans TaxID=2571270 RepID=A0A4U1C8V9_9SPHI|nr:hypothetical protein [Pedobacter cryotolerans]TKC00013.1 hypothetical protein FA045_11270 [Pedobacter cryotolerans]